MPTRRSFLAAIAGTGLLTPLGGTAAARAGGTAARRLERLGVQLFTIPKLFDEDFAAAMAMIAAVGYREVELFGPYPFSAPAAHERWKAVSASLGLKGSGYFGRTAKQVREILDRAGLTAPSMHTDLVTLRTRLDEAAEAAHVLGHRYLGIPAIPAELRRDLDGYKRVADEFNEIGRRADRLGLRLAYHNHGYGLVELEGRIPFQVVIERTDPAVVSLEMDVYWTVAGGADPVAYLDAHPGRFRLMHVKDMAKRVRFQGDGGDARQWTELFPFMADAGSGVLDLRAILSHAVKSGVQHFFLERDLTATPKGSLEGSFRYLSTLELEE